jgi:lipopolysaccharide transport system ATP-binding protein
MSRAIVVTNVSKTFRRYHPDRPWTIQEMLAKGIRRLRPIDRFWALRDVSFDVAAGRTVGIIGANGSGKSTLLRLLGGVGRADTGTLEVHGRIGALLDLGAGFHPDLTGRENALMAGVLSGLTRQEVLKRFEAIVAFAEVEKFIDHPLRTYSTGMQMRLAFATAVQADPEVLLIDEVLSVGDIAFQRKCLDRIAQFKAAGCSILLVSHEASVVQDLCDEALWLSAGRLMAQGESGDVVRQYVAYMAEYAGPAGEAQNTGPMPLPPASSPHPTVRNERGAELILDEHRFGSMELEITAVRVVDSGGQPATDLPSGHPLRIEIEYLATSRIIAPLFRVRIFREDGLVCYDLNTEKSTLSLSAIQGRGQVAVYLERVDLSSARYLVDVGCYAQDWAYAYDYRSSVHALTIRGEGLEGAVLNVPHHWEKVDGKEEAQAATQAICSDEPLI